MSPESTEPTRFTPPANDPWKGLRGVMAGVMVLELIVVLLAFPIVWRLGGGLNWFSVGYLSLLALAMVLASGMQGRPYAMKLNYGLQILVIVAGIFHWSIAVIGVIFLCVWIYIGYVKSDVERRVERGMLAGQEPIADA